MKLLVILLLLLTVSPLFAAELFTTATIETYRVTSYDSYMVSPNLFIQYGRFEVYGFVDRYFDESEFYHGELMLAFQPLSGKIWERFSIIAERRWDKFARDENSFGLRVRIW